MSLKAELETWSAALAAYEAEDFERALDLFSPIAETSKILFNMGIIHATLGEHEVAVERFIEATIQDKYLAVAYFQCGVSNFLLGRYDLACKDFEETILWLRGNQFINYEQLGLKFKLYSAEAFFNRGISLINLGRTQEGMADMQEAARQKATDDHNVINEIIADGGLDATVFSIPVGVLYRPNEKKVANKTTKDYMGKARLIASSDTGDTGIGFMGYERLKQGISPSGIYVNTKDKGVLNRSATAPAAAAVPKAAEADDVKPVPIARSNTILDGSSDARERLLSRSPEKALPSAGGLARNPSASGRGAGFGGPVRSPSVRKPGASQPPAPPAKDNRLTDIYNDYLDSYGDEAPSPPLTSEQRAGKPDRIAAWARNNANPNNAPPPPTPLARPGMRNAPPSSYAPSSFGGTSVRRKLTRRPTARMPRSPPISTYEDEEEGYGSGEYDETVFDLMTIRVKLHYQGEIRGMTFTPETAFDEFMDMVTFKFKAVPGGLSLKFKDEDGGKVTMRDESDYEMAIETAREVARGKPEGKLEVWCDDVALRR